MTPQSERRVQTVSVPGARRRGGRPALAMNEPTTGVSVKMPASLYDRLYQRARRDRVSIAEAIRRALRTAV